MHPRARDVRQSRQGRAPVQGGPVLRQRSRTDASPHFHIVSNHEVFTMLPGAFSCHVRQVQFVKNAVACHVCALPQRAATKQFDLPVLRFSSWMVPLVQFHSFHRLFGARRINSTWESDVSMTSLTVELPSVEKCLRCTTGVCPRVCRGVNAITRYIAPPTNHRTQEQRGMTVRNETCLRACGDLCS